MTRWTLIWIAALTALAPALGAQEAGSAAEKLGTLLQQKPDADADPEAVKQKLKELIDAASKHSDQLADGNSPRRRFAAISLMIQAMALYIHRWPEDPDTEGFKTILSIKADQLRQMKLGGDDPRAAADFTSQTEAVADYWQMALALDQNNRSENTLEKKRENAATLLQNFLRKHPRGPQAEAARTSLKKLGITPAPPEVATTGGSFEILPKVDTDAAGITVYSLRSDFQPEPTKLRILEPESGKPQALLLVLPVEPKTKSDFGDPMAAIKQAGLHNKHNLLVVMPTFAQIPWYADHPSKATVRQESHLTQAVLPAVDKLFPPDKGTKRRRLLLGFSKSGWGAVSLLVRHPALFDAAAAWDAPLMVADVDRYEMKTVFGTKAYFNEEYQLVGLLRQQAPLLQKTKRIGLMGHAFFKDQMNQAHELLGTLKIPHHYSPEALTEHKWDPKWIAPAIETLLKMSGTE